MTVHSASSDGRCCPGQHRQLAKLQWETVVDLTVSPVHVTPIWKLGPCKCNQAEMGPQQKWGGH